MFVCASLQPFLSSNEASNKMTGKIKLGSETLATLEGHWDQEVYIKDKATGVRGTSRVYTFCKGQQW